MYESHLFGVLTRVYQLVVTFFCKDYSIGWRLEGTTSLAFSHSNPNDAHSFNVFIKVPTSQFYTLVANSASYSNPSIIFCHAMAKDYEGAILH